MYDCDHSKGIICMSSGTEEMANLVSATDVERWRIELGRIIEEENEMKARHAAEEKAIKAKRTKLEKLVSAAEDFVSITAEANDRAMETDGEVEASIETVDSGASAEPLPRKAKVHPRRKRGKSWTATILRLVNAADRRLSYTELKNEVSKTHLGPTLEKTDRAFYGGVGKLERRGLVVRHKGWVFSTKAYGQFMKDVAAGKIDDDPAPTFITRERRSDNVVAIERFLATRPNGATTGEIVRSLLTNPPDDLVVTNNRNSIYNLLKRQREDGKLIRRGDRHYLPRQNDEAPDSSKSSAPNNHGNGSGTLFSSGNDGSVRSLIAASPGAIPAQPGE